MREVRNTPVPTHPEIVCKLERCKFHPPAPTPWKRTPVPRWRNSFGTSAKGGGVLRIFGCKNEGRLNTRQLYRLFACLVGMRPNPLGMSAPNTGKRPLVESISNTHRKKKRPIRPMLIVFNSDVRKGWRIATPMNHLIEMTARMPNIAKSENEYAKARFSAHGMGKWKSHY